MTLRANLRRFWTLYKLDIAAVVVLLLLAGIPRLTGLGTFLTADEKNWIGRSYEFVRAFKDFRFNDMLQTTHPGVTTMWASGVAIVATIFFKHIPFSFRNLQHFVTSSQLPIALLNALAVPAIYLFLRKLLPGRLLPFLAAALVALDPFLIGYSRVAHVDALLASFLFLACLSVMTYVRTLHNRRWLVISAVFSALALLTKIPAIFVVPFFILTLLVLRPDFIRHKEFLYWRGRDFVEWALIIALLFFLIWPALLWVPNPQGNVLVLKRDFVAAAITPHDTNEDYTLNTWHYPAAILTRTTPVTLIFASLLVVLLLISLFKPLKALEGVNKRIVLLIVAYIFFFVVMMTLGAKKGDRYILPVWPALDTLAALGIWVVYTWRKRIGQFLIGVVAIFLVVTWWQYHPYAIAYSNPLFADNLSQELGWGEGLDQVAAWFNENDPQAVVASWYPEELGAYTSARIIHINGHAQNSVKYVVLYRNMFGRAPDHYANDFIDEYFKKKEPVFVAHVVGKEFAWVYAKRMYERVVGEILPSITVGQAVVPQGNGLAGIEFLPATYSGTAKQGTLIVTINDETTVLLTQRIPVSELEDNGWYRVVLPESVNAMGKALVVELTAEGTAPQAAPTIRYTAINDYREGDWASNGNQKAGDLAIRLVYQTDKGLVTEEDSKLFTY